MLIRDIVFFAILFRVKHFILVYILKFGLLSIIYSNLYLLVELYQEINCLKCFLKLFFWQMFHGFCETFLTAYIFNYLMNFRRNLVKIAYKLAKNRHILLNVFNNMFK